MKSRQMIILLLILAFQCLVGNWIGAKGYAAGSPAAAFQVFIDALPGMGWLLLLVLAGALIHHLIPWKGLPAVAYIVTLACIVTIPGFPGAETITAAVNKINFVGLCTPILGYAGLAVGKDLGALKQTGWRIVLVGLFVFVGTFVGSAVIAELVLRATGKV